MEGGVSKNRARVANSPEYYIGRGRHTPEWGHHYIALAQKIFFAVGPSPAEIIPSPRYGRRANSLWALWSLNYSGPGAQAAALSSVRCGVRCPAGQASRIGTLGNSS